MTDPRYTCRKADGKIKTIDELKSCLISLNKREIHIDEFIKANAKTRSIKPLRELFEELIKREHSNISNMSFSRTSEIFITKGTKKEERQKKYFPLVGSYYSQCYVK